MEVILISFITYLQTEVFCLLDSRFNPTVFACSKREYIGRCERGRTRVHWVGVMEISFRIMNIALIIVFRVILIYYTQRKNVKSIFIFLNF